MRWDSSVTTTEVLFIVLFALLDFTNFVFDFLIVFFEEIHNNSVYWDYHDGGEYQVADTLRDFSHPMRFIFAFGFLLFKLNWSSKQILLGWVLLAEGFLWHKLSDCISDIPLQVLYSLVIHILHRILFLPTCMSYPDRVVWSDL